MKPVKVNRDRLLKAIDALSMIGRVPQGGVSRFTFSDADLRARMFVSKLMEDSGLQVRLDPFANIIGHLEGSSEELPVAMLGSHIDTVPNGGPLDGAYGVLSAIEVAHRIREENIPIRNPVEVIVFTEEEGARFPGFLGSMGFTRAIRKEDIYALTDKNGISFEQALRQAGLDPTKLTQLHPRPEEVKCYVELHIEQGPVLEHERITIGAVEAIVGLGELMVEFRGNPRHAGATPLALRHDPMLAASRFVIEVNNLVRKINSTAIATVGAITVSPNISSVIAGQASLLVDFRDTNHEAMVWLQNQIVSLAHRAAQVHGLELTTLVKSFTNPAVMSPRIVETIAKSAEMLNLPWKRMRSGAGHDCQLMATCTETGMIFVPSQGGRSHCPDESSLPEHLEAGANVLLNTILQLANSRSTKQLTSQSPSVESTE
jgi:hydantoinase/carbamoylase family amidase